MPEFDALAPVYDTTREPPAPEEVEGVVAAFDGHRSILEAGVGTGRYSVPLRARGLSMTGIDLSLEMMRRARSKGLDRLVRADLYRLPFRDGTFDAALIVHVLQLLPDPFRALAELGRVARQRVVAVFPDRPPGREEPGGRFRSRYRELAAARGLTLPPRVRYWENGSRLLTEVPPAFTRHFESERPAEAARARRWEDPRAFGCGELVPPQVHREIIAELRAELGSREALPAGREHHRRMTVAVWTHDQAAELFAHRAPPGAAGRAPS